MFPRVVQPQLQAHGRNCGLSGSGEVCFRAFGAPTIPMDYIWMLAQSTVGNWHCQPMTRSLLNSPIFYGSH